MSLLPTWIKYAHHKFYRVTWRFLTFLRRLVVASVVRTATIRGNTWSKFWTPSEMHGEVQTHCSINVKRKQRMKTYPWRNSNCHWTRLPSRIWIWAARRKAVYFSGLWQVIQWFFNSGRLNGHSRVQVSWSAARYEVKEQLNVRNKCSQILPNKKKVRSLKVQLPATNRLEDLSVRSIIFLFKVLSFLLFYTSILRSTTICAIASSSRG